VVNGEATNTNLIVFRLTRPYSKKRSTALETNTVSITLPMPSLI